ncbi:MAG: TetR/AcrR family transcriptional regulator [Planctomycetes bacterium]|nr:TetR/AcrR family transcriptional regulator [Planctomycetota bacterium]
MNRGRPRQFDEKKALLAAMEVFWSKGFEGASCDELLAAMGIKCGSMYLAFGDKQALYDRAFDLYCETEFLRGMEILDGPGTPLENIRTLVQCWGEHMTQPDSKGCFVSNTVIEFSKQPDGVAQLARQVLKRMQDVLENKLKQAADAGELRDGANPAALAAFLVNTANGLNVMARARADKKSIQGVIDSTLLILA